MNLERILFTATLDKNRLAGNSMTLIWIIIVSFPSPNRKSQLLFWSEFRLESLKNSVAACHSYSIPIGIRIKWNRVRSNISGWNFVRGADDSGILKKSERIWIPSYGYQRRSCIKSLPTMGLSFSILADGFGWFCKTLIRRQLPYFFAPNLWNISTTKLCIEKAGIT